MTSAYQEWICPFEQGWRVDQPRFCGTPWRGDIQEFEGVSGSSKVNHLRNHSLKHQPNAICFRWDWKPDSCECHLTCQQVLCFFFTGFLSYYTLFMEYYRVFKNTQYFMEWIHRVFVDIRYSWMLFYGSRISFIMDFQTDAPVSVSVPAMGAWGQSLVATCGTCRDQAVAADGINPGTGWKEPANGGSEVSTAWDVNRVVFWSVVSPKSIGKSRRSYEILNDINGNLLVSCSNWSMVKIPFGEWTCKHSHFLFPSEPGYILIILSNSWWLQVPHKILMYLIHPPL